MSVNPVQSNAELDVKYYDVVAFHREPPPPYSLPEAVPEPVVTIQPVSQAVQLKPILRGRPTFCQCPHCGHRGLSTVKYVNTTKTHLLAGCLFGVTIWCCLCCFGAIPYCWNKCKDVSHYCSNCEAHLGSYSNL